MDGRRRGVAEAAPPPPLLLLALLTCTYRSVSGDRIVVGDTEKWKPGVNYTEWAGRHQFFLHDWLVFYYERDYYDVMEVNETAYKNCISDDPIWNYSKGNRFAFELNETRRYYFLCSRGYCYQGMKFSVLVEPLPPPLASPSPPELSGTVGLLSGSSGRRLFWVCAAVVGMAWDALIQMV